ncbi:carboxypeptidase regulatory-like domain-containing protein [candidate division KSB1 bacterium]|nr:carboxypeptidase regulatory-like domain-containing protein [candidate division KSB1 bacterium]
MKANAKISSILRFSGINSCLVLLPIILIFLFPNISLSSQFGRISGFVFSETGAPLENVKVRAIVYEGQYQLIYTHTDQNGYYLLDSLNVGKYQLRTLNESGYLDEFYDNVFDQKEASVFKILQGSDIQNINFELSSNGGAIIDGEVRDEITSNAIVGITVKFINAATKMEHATSTNQKGYFRSPILTPGAYHIYVDGSIKSYASEYYDNKYNIEDADTVVLSQVGAIRTVNFRLKAIKSGITGSVFEELTGAPIDDAWVVAYSPDKEWKTDTRTDKNGNYHIKGIGIGHYYVKVSGINPWSYFTEFFDNAPDFNSAELVQVDSETVTHGIDFLIEKVSNRIISNAFIQIAVSDKYNGSNISVGNDKGLPETPEDDNSNLISDFPNPEMSYTSIWLDGEIYRYGSPNGIRLAQPAISDDQKSIRRSWAIQDIEIIQITSLVESPWSLMHYEDTAKLEYIIINRSSGAHQIGLRILLDTMLGNTDGVPISVPNSPLILTEQDFTENTIPTIWRAIKCDVVDGDTVNVSFSVQGTLRNYGATCPDRFVIAKYGNIDQKKHYWDYDTNGDLQIIEDSAIALWWYPQTVNSNDTLRIVTYYGLGEGIPDRQPPEIVQYYPPQGSTVNPDTSIRFVITDNKTGVDTTSVKASIKGHDAKIRFEGPIDSLTVYCTIPEKFKYNQSIPVAISSIADLSVPANVRPAEAYSFDIFSDYDPPSLVSHSPENGARNVDPDTTVEIIVKDTLAGMDCSSIELFINGISVTDLCSLIQSDTSCLIRYKPPEPFAKNDTIVVRILASDLADPPNLLTLTYVFYTFEKDTVPPKVVYVFPDNGATGVARDTQIILHLMDEITGINADSIKLRINDKLVPVSHDSTAHYMVVTFNSERALCFEYEENVRLELDACDIDTNRMETFFSQFQVESEPPILPDTTAPVVSAYTPKDHQPDIPISTPIQVRILDTESGVNIDSVKLWINDEFMPPQTIWGDSSNYFIQYHPVPFWKFDDTIHVVISAEDLADQPNKMENVSFEFYTEKDTITTPPEDRAPPEISEKKPEDREQNVVPATTVEFVVADSGTGVEIDSLQVWLNNKSQQFEYTGDSSRFHVIVRPELPFEFSETVLVSAKAMDRAERSNKVIFNWYFKIIDEADTTAPYSENHIPKPSQPDVSPETEIYLQIVDALSGVDTSSIKMQLGGRLIEPVIASDAGNKRVSILYQPTQPFRYNDSVTVDLVALDLAQQPNRLQESYFFKIKRDTVAPYVTEFKPSGIDVNPRTSISFSIHDDLAGVDTSSVEIRVNGIKKAIFIDYYNPRHIQVELPEEQFEIGQEVNVAIKAADLALQPNQMMEYKTFRIRENLPDLSLIDLVTQPQKDIKMNQPFAISATIENHYSRISKPFKVSFYLNGDTLSNQLIFSMDDGERLSLTTEAQLPQGTYRLKAQVDSDDQITELLETNNSKDALIEVIEGQLKVRPNPFTPNNDGYNDDAIFNFEELNLKNPTLKLFNFEGLELRSLEATSDKSFRWNGRDQNGTDMLPGIYLFVLFDNENAVARGTVVLAR